MAKVTSKFQVTVPKAVADRYKIQPGDDIEWVPAGEFIRVKVSGNRETPVDREARGRLFDRATERIRKRESPLASAVKSRGWKREDLYRRGRSG